MIRFVVFLFFAAALWLTVEYWPWRAIRHAPGVLVAKEPVQVMIPEKLLPKRDHYEIHAVATYDITARILSTKRYFSLPGNDLVPIDVAVGWGRMSDQAVLDRLSISQGNRFFFYEWWNSPPIPQSEIACHAANMHLIAADSEVASSIRGLRTGQVADLRGYLVNVTGPEGFSWRTSLSRTDTGNGACELFYVEEIQDVPVVEKAPAGPALSRLP